MMKIFRLMALVALASVASTASADTIKVGVIGPMSGPFSIYGQNFQWGLEAYAHANGSNVGEDTIEFVYRDLPGIDPAKARALAQELVVKDRVQYLVGAYFTPNAMAMTPLLETANTPLILLNAATSSITESSPYVVRTSFTMWQNTVPAAMAAHQDGFNKIITVVSDYGPGIDAETAFVKSFVDAGGEVVDSVRLPLSTSDFNPIMQRIRDSGADGIFVFLPGGPSTISFINAYFGNKLNEAGIKILSTGDFATENVLPAMGELGVGIKTTYHYSAAHASPENAAFKEAAVAVGADPDSITMAAVAAFDGAKLIYEMIGATGGEKDAAKAVEAVLGMSWESPRGPVSIDPETRHIIQNVYLRELQLVNGKLQNTEIGTFEAQPDWGLVSN